MVFFQEENETLKNAQVTYLDSLNFWYILTLTWRDDVLFSDIVTIAFDPTLLRPKVTCLISDKIVFWEPPPSCNSDIFIFMELF